MQLNHECATWRHIWIQNSGGNCRGTLGSASCSRPSSSSSLASVWLAFMPNFFLVAPVLLVCIASFLQICFVEAVLVGHG